MKNLQKGFVVPLLIAIIAVLVIGGGVYVYENKKVEVPTPIVDTSATTTSDWKTYTNDKYGFEFEYPTNLAFHTAQNTNAIFPLREGLETDNLGMPDPSHVSYSIHVGVTPATTTTQCMSDYYATYGDKITPPKPVTPMSTFKMYLRGDNDMGGSSIQTTYATWRDNTCYALSSYVYQGNLSKIYDDNDPQKVVAQKAAQVALQQITHVTGKIFSTFVFTSSSSTTATLTSQAILNLSNASLIAGGVRWSGYQLSVDKNRIIFGDLDGDGVNEAIAPVSYCSASCGMSVYVLKLYQGKIILTEIPETSVAGAAQDIKSLQIKNGLVVVTETDFSGTRTNSYRIQLVNGKLVSTSI